MIINMKSFEKFSNIPTPESSDKKKEDSSEELKEGLKISEEEFEEQFKESVLKVDEHEILYSKIKPKETISDKYVLYLGGFSQGKETYRDELKNLAESGRKVLYTNQLDGVTPSKEDSLELDKFDLPETIKNKVAEVLVLLDHLKIDRVDIAGHSQGAIIATVVAALRPGIADNLVLLNPAGLYGDDSRFGISWRSIKGQIAHTKSIAEEEDVEEKARLGIVQERIKDDSKLRTDILWRLRKEIPGIAATDIVPILKEIKSNQEELSEDEKTRITLLTAYSDATFSREKTEEHLGIKSSPETSDEDISKMYEKVFEEVIDSHAMYKEKEASHNAPIFEKPGALTQIVNQ